MAIAQRNRALLDIAQTLLFIPDLFNYFFTGEKIRRILDHHTSQMYDPRKKAWATDMLKSSNPHPFPAEDRPLRNAPRQPARRCRLRLQRISQHSRHRAGLSRHRQHRRRRAGNRK